MKRLIYIALVLVFCSCERQLTINLPDLETKLVVNAFANSDEPLAVYLAENTDLLGNPALRSLEEPFRLILSENSTPIHDKMYMADSGLIQTNIVLKQGSSYELVIEGQGRAVINAEDDMPDLKPSFELMEIKTIGQQAQLDLLMLDHSGPQYYMMELALHSYEVTGNDTVWYARELDFTSSDKIFFTNINTIRAQTHFALFDDQLLHGTDRMIKIVIDKQDLISRAGYTVSHVSADLKSLSPGYFNYYIGLLENTHIYGGPLASSTHESGNIKGGLGIFGCYTLNRDTIHLH